MGNRQCDSDGCHYSCVINKERGKVGVRGDVWIYPPPPGALCLVTEGRHSAPVVEHVNVRLKGAV